MAFRLKVPVAKTFVALGSVAAGGGSHAQLDAYALPGIAISAVPLLQLDGGGKEDGSGQGQGQGQGQDPATLTREEIRVSVSAVLAGKGMGEVYRKVPRDWATRDFSLMKDIIGDAVESVLLGLPPTLAARSAQGVTASYKNSGLHAEVSNRFNLLKSTEKLPDPSVIEDWNCLVSEHQCCICMDLLAAPVIIDCSHNFCGECLHQYLRVPRGEDEKDVTHFCPTCRVEIDSNAIYERGLDDAIVSKVNSFAGVEGSEAMVLEWRQRREEHRARMKKASGGGSGSSSGSGGGPQDLDPPFDDIETYILWVIAFVAVASLTVATFLRRR
jgi:hypothetical protein